MNIFIEAPQLQKITLSSIHSASDKISGNPFNFNLSFTEMGWDQINIVEFIMELEKLNGIAMNDDIAQMFMDEELHFGKTFVSIIRDERINQILND